MVESRRYRVFIHLAAVVVSLIFLAPFAWLLIASVSLQADLLAHFDQETDFAQGLLRQRPNLLDCVRADGAVVLIVRADGVVGGDGCEVVGREGGGHIGEQVGAVDGKQLPGGLLDEPLELAWLLRRKERGLLPAIEGLIERRVLRAVGFQGAIDSSGGRGAGARNTHLRRTASTWLFLLILVGIRGTAASHVY